MSIRFPRRASHRARSTVLGAIFGVAWLNLGLAWWVTAHPGLRDPMFDQPAELYRKRVEAVKEHPPTTVVFLGSSRTGYGVRPAVAERMVTDAIGEPCLAHNLHVRGNGPVGQLVHWRRLVDRRARPDVVVLEICPARFASHGRLPDDFFTYSGGRLSRDEVRLAEAYGFTRETQADWRQANWNPWYGFRFNILTHVQPRWVPGTDKPMRRRAATDLGWESPLRSVSDPGRYPEAVAFNRPLLYDRMQRARFDGAPAASFRELVRSSLTLGTVPAAFVTPEATPIRAWYSPAAEEGLQAFLTELRGMGVIVKDGRAWLPDLAFHDGHHAVRSWADEYTRCVTAEVVLPAVERARAKRSNGDW